MNLASLTFPAVARPDISGAAVAIRQGIALLRDKTPVPNVAVQEMVKNLPDFDGVFTTTNPYGPAAREKAELALMEPEGFPELWYWVYDVRMNHDHPLFERVEIMTRWASASPNYVRSVTWFPITSLKNYYDVERRILDMGHRDIVVHPYDAAYGDMYAASH